MPRLARTVVAGCAHHITQRGNNRQDVFFVDDDRDVYLELLREQAGKYGLDIVGYCLMVNHVHIVAIPQAEDSLAKAVGRAHFRYTQYINRFHKRSGHLWQDRFFSCPLGQDHFQRALVYVERNPVRARLVRKAWRWRWSSAPAHCGIEKNSDLLDISSWKQDISFARWRRLLEHPDDKRLVSRLRLSTSRGRPLGSDAFIAKLETLLGRRLRPLPRGRPINMKE